MVYKTSDIYKILKTATSMDKSSFFKMGDVVCAKERRSTHPLREELLKISPNLLRILEERELLKEHSVGYGLTEQGYSILKEFEEARKKYGSENVEIIPAKVGDIISYKVRVNPNAKMKVKGKVQPSKIEPLKEEYEKRKQHTLEFLSKLKDERNFITAVEEGENSLFIKTHIHYFRTTQERQILDEIARDLGMQIKSIDEDYVRNYCFLNEQSRVILISKKSGKGFKTCKPLEVKIDLKQPVESAEKLIISLSEKFKR